VAEWFKAAARKDCYATQFWTFSTITRARGMLSFVQLLILQRGKESPQFEATFLIAAKPSEHCIATGHVRIEAKVAK
jgi:hypothetical protein